MPEQFKSAAILLADWDRDSGGRHRAGRIRQQPLESKQKATAVPGRTKASAQHTTTAYVAYFTPVYTKRQAPMVKKKQKNRPSNSGADAARRKIANAFVGQVGQV